MLKAGTCAVNQHRLFAPQCGHSEYACVRTSNTCSSFAALDLDRNEKVVRCPLTRMGVERANCVMPAQEDFAGQVIEDVGILQAVGDRAHCLGEMKAHVGTVQPVGYGLQALQRTRVDVVHGRTNQGEIRVRRNNGLRDASLCRTTRLALGLPDSCNLAPDA